MASKELWKGIGVAGEREPPTYLARSLNQLSEGPREGEGEGVAPGASPKSLNKASSKRKSNIEAQNPVAATENKCSNSEALDKEKELMYDYEEGLGHSHRECIKKRRMLWGPRADSPPPSPIPSKRKSNIEAQNSVAATEKKCSNSEALDKEKEWMYDYEEGLGHNHQKCIEGRRKLWGPRADSPPPIPIPIEVFLPFYPPELVVELNKLHESDIEEAMSIHELEFQKVFAKMDALEAQKLSSPMPHSVSQGVNPADVLP